MNCNIKQQETCDVEKRGCEGCFYNDKALKHINTTFKFSQIGYGQGFYEGQMQERKYWKDKIKAKINELEKEQKENQEELHKRIDLLCDVEIDNVSNKILVNLSIREVLQSFLEREEKENG